MQEDNKEFKLTSTAETVLKERYYIGGESCWTDLTHRCAKHIAKDDEEYKLFKGVMDRMDFLANSPFLMNAGTAINAYSACYVLPVEDSIESIYKFYSDAAIISKSGGGVGCNYSQIRASNSLVNSTDGVASGPLSFMKVQDVSTDIIKQGGRRRGANMGILMCDHKDVWDFVGAKDTAGSLENFNLSVGITDDFMGMVKMDGIGGSTQAGLWDELICRAWSSAEPGVLFLDTAESANTVKHLGKLDACNPCGELFLLPYENCCLGSVNLSNHVKDGDVDWDKLKTTVTTGTLFLNRILDKSEMPIPECDKAMRMTRKIGLGFAGLGALLIKVGLPYDSEEGRVLAAKIQQFVYDNADIESTRLGKVDGLYDGWIEGCPERRNAVLTCQAPTGTLSMLMDTSSGVEPYYSPITYKTVLDGTTFCMPCPELLEMARARQVESEGESWVS